MSVSGMNQNLPNIDITNALQNPSSTFDLTAHQGSFATEAFSPEEASLFNQQLQDLFVGLMGSVHAGILGARQQTIAKVATHAKHELDDKVFGGVNANDNQIGVAPLRPGHIYSDPTGTIQNDWYFSPGTTGWVDWIGDGTQANNYTIDEDHVVAVFAFSDQSDGQSAISGMNVDQFGRNMDMLPQDLNDARLRDNESEQQTVELPTLVGSENDDAHVRLRFDRDVERQPRLFGLTFGLGSFLNNEDYS